MKNVLTPDLLVLRQAQVAMAARLPTPNRHQLKDSRLVGRALWTPARVVLRETIRSRLPLMVYKRRHQQVPRCSKASELFLESSTTVRYQTFVGSTAPLKYPQQKHSKNYRNKHLKENSKDGQKCLLCFMSCVQL